MPSPTPSRPKPLLAGNWKMNGTRAGLAEIAAIRDAVSSSRFGGLDVLVCPPFTLLMAAADLCSGSGLLIGGQDCHPEPSGAHTGDVSAEMLRDAGARAVLVGHSERRQRHGDTDDAVRAKAEAAARAGLVAVVCVGETRAEHEAGRTLEVVGRQIDASVPPGATGIAVAYEPVWAIGTGLTPSIADIAAVHAFMRDSLERRHGAEGRAIRLLYGGSVKPANAADVWATGDVDGLLVGGASLKADEFLGIAAAR